MKIRAFIFDLDGTLVDTKKDLANAVNYSLRKHGFKERSLDEIVSYLGNGSNVLINKAIGHEVDEELFKSVFDTYVNYYYDNVAVESTTYEGMNEVIDELKKKGMLVMCLTNKPMKPTEELIDKLFKGQFDYVLGNSKDIPTKPSTVGINMIFKKFNLKPEEVVYLGDSDVDMILADNAKIEKKVACSYGYRPLKELMAYNPYKIIKSPKEILDLDLLKKC